jgi:hypothetical protein
MGEYKGEREERGSSICTYRKVGERVAIVAHIGQPLQLSQLSERFVVIVILDSSSEASVVLAADRSHRQQKQGEHCNSEGSGRGRVFHTGVVAGWRCVCVCVLRFVPFCEPQGLLEILLKRKKASGE